jgi:uncharacterized membrane protein YqaE (UPF0057 family)
MTRTDRLMAALFWLNVALFLVGFVIWARSGHPPVGVFVSAAASSTGSLYYLWTRIP